MLTDDEIRAIYRQGEETTVAFIKSLLQKIDSLEQRLQAVEQQLAKNSGNSSKPPSSDGYQKPAPKSLRTSSGKKSGGQPGHKGKTLSRVKDPDRVIVHPLDSCLCGADLSKTPAQDYENRQVFDLPEPKLEVTEHRCEIKDCPDCGERVTASFPADVVAPVQYGLRFQSLLVYLKDGQLLPLDRIGQLCADLYGYDVSAATIESARKECHGALEPFEEELKEGLIGGSLLHSDESGLRVEGSLHWLHLCSTALMTFYGVHKKRWNEAMDFFGILPLFTGTLIHDGLAAYQAYACDHALCNAHHLRELKFVHEELRQRWAGKMARLLCKMNEFVKEQSPVSHLTEAALAPWLKKYAEIIKEGYGENPEPPVRRGKRGRPKKTKAQNLLGRLDQYRKYVLAFLYDFRIPFTNNQAEQDIRMIKVQQKISGGFRTLEGARMFARIRSYISTVRKHRLNVFRMITHALEGQPFIPAPG
jgi:transposase